MAKKKKKGMRWFFSVYDPYTDKHIARCNNLTGEQFDTAVKEFRLKF